MSNPTIADLRTKLAEFDSVVEKIEGKPRQPQSEPARLSYEEARKNRIKRLERGLGAGTTKDAPEVRVQRGVEQLRQQLIGFDKKVREEVKPDQTREDYLNEVLHESVLKFQKQYEEEGQGNFLWLLERIPFTGVGVAIGQGISDLQALDNIQSGEATELDMYHMGRVLAKQKHMADRSWLQKTADATSMLPAFAVEFALTGGAFRAGKVGTQLALKKLGVSVAKRKMAGVAVGVVAHATAQPHRIAANAIERLAPEYGLSLDEQKQLQFHVADESQNKSLLRAIGEGYLDNVIEVASEYSGGVFGKIPGMAKLSSIKGALLGRAVKSMGAQKALALMKKGGWNGLVEELMEERVGGLARGLTGLEDFEDYTSAEFWESVSIEAASIAMYGAGAVQGGAMLQSMANTLEEMNTGEQITQPKKPTREEFMEQFLTEEVAEAFVENPETAEDAETLRGTTGAVSRKQWKEWKDKHDFPVRAITSEREEFADFVRAAIARRDRVAEGRQVDAGRVPVEEAGVQPEAEVPEAPVAEAVEAPEPEITPVQAEEPVVREPEGPAIEEEAETTVTAPTAEQVEIIQKMKDRIGSPRILKGATMEFDADTQSVEVTLADGNRTVLELGDHDAALVEFAALEGKVEPKGAYIFRTGTLPSGTKLKAGHLYLHSEADHSTVNHELIHALEIMGVITPEEVAEHGGREGIAEAYQGIAKPEPGTVFGRIYEAVEALFDAKKAFFRDVEKRVTKPVVTPVAAKPKPKSKQEQYSEESKRVAEEHGIDIEQLRKVAREETLPEAKEKMGRYKEFKEAIHAKKGGIGMTAEQIQDFEGDATNILHLDDLAQEWQYEWSDFINTQDGKSLEQALWAHLKADMPKPPKLQDTDVLEDAAKRITEDEESDLESGLDELFGEAPEKAGEEPEAAFAAKESDRAVVERLFKEHRKGSFEDFVQAVSAQLSQDKTRELGSKLAKFWKGRGKGPAGNVGAILLRQIGKAKVAPSPKKAGKPLGPDETLLTKAEIEKERKKEGRVTLAPVPKVSFDQLVKDAGAKIANEPLWVPGIINTLATNPGATTDLEHAGLSVFYGMVKKEHKATTAKLGTSSDPAVNATNQNYAKTLEQDLDNIERAADLANSLAGRALAARRIKIAADFSFAGMITRSTRSKDGEAITDAERATLLAMADKLEEHEANEARMQAEREEMESFDPDEFVEPSYEQKRREIAEAIDNGTYGAKEVPTTKGVWASAVKKAKASAAKLANLIPRKATRPGGAMSAEGPGDVAIQTAMDEAAVDGIDSGTQHLSEFLVDMNAAGVDVTGYRTELEAAWAKVASKVTPVKMKIDPTTKQPSPQSITRLAKKIMRFVVESGIENTDAVVEQVDKELNAALKGIIPKPLDRREVIDAISGYGQFQKLSTKAVDVKLRAITGQLQQIAKLDDMIRLKEAPKPTGKQQRIVEELERNLVKDVGLEKKAGKFAKPRDPAAALKSALDTAKTATTNLIADLKADIKEGSKKDRRGQPVTPDKELTRLRKELEIVRGFHQLMFPTAKKVVTEAQKIKAVEKNLDRQIATLEGEIAAGDLGLKEKGKPITSEAIKEKRRRLDGLRKQKEEAREKDAGYQEQIAARKKEAHIKGLLKRVEAWKERIKDEDFGPRPKKDQLDEDILKAQYEVDKIKAKFRGMQKKWEEARMSPVEKALHHTGSVIQLSRAFITAYDLSSTGRQGLLGTILNPRAAARGIPRMLKAWGVDFTGEAGKRAEHKQVKAMQERANFPFYKAWGLPVTSTTDELLQQEEVFIGPLNKYIPGVGASERSYTAGLNWLRAELMDMYVSNLGKNGRVTTEEGKVIAHWVGVVTGRGSLGSMEQSMGAMATTFFAPRFVAARIQFITLQPLIRAHMMGKRINNQRVRNMIALEYVKILSGLAGMYAAVYLLASLWPDDEEETKPTVTFDARSSDFGKVRMGNTRVDVLGGLSQVTVLMTRLFTGERVTQAGAVVPIRGEDVPYGSTDTFDIMANFARTKFSPIVSLGINVIARETMMGEKLTAKEVSYDLLPLSMRDVYEAFGEHGVKGGAPLGLLSIFGVGLQIYEEGEIGQLSAEAFRLRQDRAAAKKAGKPFTEVAAYHRIERVRRLRTDLRKIAKEEGKEEEYKKYGVGLSRWGLGLPDEEESPNPLLAKRLPASLRAAVNSHLATTAYTVTKRRDLKDEKPDEKSGREAAEAYLEELGIDEDTLVRLMGERLRDRETPFGWDTIREWQRRLRRRLD